MGQFDRSIDIPSERLDERMEILGPFVAMAV